MENLQTIYRKQVVTWLTICGFLVFCMIIVGGATRLTHSGLSIVEWEPIVGTIPPITNTDWNQVFDEYKGNGYSYILLYDFATLLKSNEIKTIQLDDCSDNALNYAPSRTRSGRTWNCNNVYANIGCEAEEYPSAERICDVDEPVRQLERLLMEKL